MAMTENRDSLIPITPVVTNGICFMCQNVKKESSNTIADKSHLEISKSSKKYLNIHVSDGFLCNVCLRKLESVIDKVDNLRDGILVDQAESYSNANLNKWLSAVYEASEKDKCVLTWSGPTEDVHTSLYELQKENVLCNVYLVDAKGSGVRAHACVLAAGSPVLKSTLMLQQSHDWLEKGGLSLKVADISRQEWKIIAEYLYLGRINIALNSTLIRNVHRAARMLKISSLATLIWRRVGSLRLKVDLSGEVGKVKMNLSPFSKIHGGKDPGLIPTSPDNFTEEDGKSKDRSLFKHSERVPSQEQINLKTENGRAIKEGLNESSMENVGYKQKFEELEDGHASGGVDIDQTLKMVKLENIWQEDGETMDEESMQQQLKMLKEEAELLGESMYHSSDNGSTTGNTNFGGNSMFKCKFCADAFETKVKLVEHVVQNCQNLRKTGVTFEDMIDTEDVVDLQQDVAPTVHVPKKRGRKRKNFGSTVENMVKAKPSYICFNDDCDAAFISHNLYMAHLQSCVMHSGLANPQKHVIKVEDMLVYDEGSDILDNDAGASFKPYATLCSKLHRASSKKIYQCDQCHVKGDQHRMACHLASVHVKAKTFCCKQCPSKYGYFGSFKDHYVSCHTNKTYICPQDNCKMSFTKKDSLNRHILMEHKRQGKQLFLCKGCGKMFKLAHHARRHEMYHRKEDRKHVCARCYKPFATKQDLQRHSFIHTGAKPYKCSQCTYSAARKFNLILHERKHGVLHGQYSCHICGKHFITEVNLKSHIKRHENTPQVTAPVKSTSRSSSITGTNRNAEVTNVISPLQEALLPTPSSMQVQGLDNIKVSDLNALQTAQNVQEAMTDQASSSVVYILTTGQPYDYTMVDTSMLNT